MTVVVPFAGSDQQLRELHDALSTLQLRPGDELLIVDNRLHPIHTPAYARNAGASGARGEWLVFIDADTIPDAGLLDAYFDSPPGPQSGVLAGGIRDVAARDTRTALAAVARRQMDQRATLERAGMPYVQTANCAIRRSAFEAVGGFDPAARAGEDADLCFRLQRAGWRIEERPSAVVDHRSRATVAAWLRQMLVHGSGAAWIERRWPGELPAPGPRRLARRLARHAADAARSLAHGDLRGTETAVLDLLGAAAFELGRLYPNTRHRRG